MIGKQIRGASEYGTARIRWERVRAIDEHVRAVDVTGGERR